MTISFDKAPLVELIVELKWGSSSILPSIPQPGGAVQGFFHMGDQNRQEEFYMRFGGECYARGLQRTERIAPAGFPLLPGQVAVRYKSGEPKSNKLLQVGPGVFTANAIAPYEGWDQFLPYLKNGFECLLAARDESEKEERFHTATIRCINAFGKDYLEVYSQTEILEKLGFNIQLPQVIQEEVVDDAHNTSVLNISTKTSDGARLTFTSGSGQAGNDKAVIFDIALAYEHVNVNEAIDKIISAHKKIDEIFIKSTEPLHQLMGIREI